MADKNLGDYFKDQLPVKTSNLLMQNFGLTLSGNFRRYIHGISPSSLPIALSNCEVWLDASDVSTINIATGVDIWADKSGNNRDAISPIASFQPSWNANSFNSLPVISFNNGAKYLDLPTLPYGTADFDFTSNPFTVFVVFKYNTVFFQGILAKGNDLTNERTFAIIAGNSSTPDLKLYTKGSVREDFIPLVKLDDSQPHISSVTWDGTAGGFFVDSYGGAYSAGTGALFGDNLRIGQRSSTQTVTAFDGDIAEIIIYSRSLPTFERQLVEGYLAWKWGTVAGLPQGHPFKINRPFTI